MKVLKSDITRGLPPEFSGDLMSITPIEGTRLLSVVLDYAGIDVSVPLSKEAVASIISKRGVVPTNPGEVIPDYKKRNSSSRPKVGPKVGSTKVVNGITKKLIKYDFVTPRLKGKRRVMCPESNKKGFPIWEKQQ